MKISWQKNFWALILAPLLISSGCMKQDASGKKENTVWIYTSMYKDTITDLTPRLEKAFPGVKFNWYQAGSEDIATKVNAEMINGKIQADLLISSDRFWYEDLAQQGHLQSYSPLKTDKIRPELKNEKSLYTTLSIPVMVLCYNNEAIPADQAPSSFKDLALPKWKAKFSTGSPLSSGTNFTTMAVLQSLYGWDYFESLKKNETISEGGNSAVIRRIQSKERPIGWVLLENILRFQGKDERLKIIYPKDVIITHTNVLAIPSERLNLELVKKVADFLYTDEGQEAMTRSYMYSPFENFKAPEGAPPLSELLDRSFKWSGDFLTKMTRERLQLKEKLTEIMFR